MAAVRPHDYADASRPMKLASAFNRAIGLTMALAISLAATSLSARSQSSSRSGFTPLAADSPNSPALAAPVTVIFADTPLSDIVSAIAKQAGLSLTFDPTLPGLDRKVSVSLTSTPAARALLRALDNTPIQAMVSASGQVVLVARPAPARRVGVLEGTVRDAVTDAPVSGARVELLGTRFVTLSRERGEFSFGRMPVGAYSARITRLGFQPFVAENLTVASDVVSPPINAVLEHAPIPLSAVVVTPGYFGMMEPTLGASQTMSRERIETVPQIGEDIYRAVNRLPGVTSNDFSADFSVRGGSGSELYVTLDGLELIEPFHIKDVGGGLSILDSRAIGGVDLTTGGFSAEYGDRLTGVFTMRSVDPRLEGARTSVGLSVMNARAMSQGVFGKGRGTWLVSARRGYLDLALKLSNSGDSINPRYYDLFAKTQYDFGRAGTLGLHALDAGDAMKYLDNPDPSIRSRYRSSYLWTNWEGRFGHFRQQTVASLGRLTWRRDGERLDDNVITAQITDRRNLTIGGVRQDWSMEMGSRALLKFGFDVKQASTDYDYFSAVGDVEVQNGTRVLVWDTTEVVQAPTSSRTGLYVAPRFRPFSSLAVELGLRYDRASHTGDEELSPRLNVSWQPRSGTSVRGAWGEYSQSQSLAGLQAQDGIDRFFSAERAEHRVIGVEQMLGRGLTARVEAYERRLSNLHPRFVSAGPGVEVFPEINWDRVRIDAERGRARGTELLLSHDQGRRVLWSAGYGLASVADRIDGKNVPRNTDQRHTVTGDWAYRSKKWRLSVATVWHSGWPYTPEVLTVDTVASTPNRFDIQPTSTPGELNSGRLPWYRRVDARWTRFIDTRNGRVALFLEAYNLLDSRNRRGYSSSLFIDGRNRRVVVGREDATWIPRLPTFGITWEFGSGAR